MPVDVYHEALESYTFYGDGTPTWLFCENDTNPRLWDAKAELTGFYKDGFHDYLVHDRSAAVNPLQTGTKAGALYRVTVPAGGKVDVRMRLMHGTIESPFALFDNIMAQRQQEADQFYAFLQAGMDDDDARRIQRQALAGMIWSKQFYYYDIPKWLKGDQTQPPPPPERLHGRNSEWMHLNNADIISLPDKWEYPWFAAWDLCFHCLPLAMIDPDFAKDQLVLILREWYMHPNGQLPAYEWNFSDVNPAGAGLGRLACLRI